MFKKTTLDYISKEPALAKQVVRGLENEVRRLQKQLGVTSGPDASSEVIEEIGEWLIEQQQANKILKQKMFGRSSERHEDSQDSEKDKAERRARTKPENSGRQEIGSILPLKEDIYSLPESAICVSCSMNKIDPKSYFRETIIRIRHCRGLQLPHAFANQREQLDLK